MKAVVNADGSFTIESVEVEANTVRDLFEGIAQAQREIAEVFGDLTCSNGKESSDKVQLNVRIDDEENKYYEALCVDTSKPSLRYAKKRFGVNKKGGGLFPKGGWVKWDRDQSVEVDLITGKPVQEKE